MLAIGAPSPFLDPTGLGLATAATTCGALGVATLTSVTEIAQCVERHHECRVEQMLDSETPRFRELLDLGGTTVP